MTLAKTLIERAKAAGYENLILTVDVPRLARRPRDTRNGFQTPFKMTLKHAIDFASHPVWTLQTALSGIPKMANYENIKKFIDFTKYYVMFRGPRVHRHDCTTRKPFAHSFDVYQRSGHDMVMIRTEREAFNRGVRWANNRSH